VTSAETEFNQVKQLSNEQLWTEVVSLRSQVRKLTRENQFNHWTRLMFSMMRSNNNY